MSATDQNNVCENHNDKTPHSQQLSCSYFRTMLEKITSITDTHILDEVERLHIECRNCPITVCDQNQQVAINPVENQGMAVVADTKYVNNLFFIVEVDILSTNHEYRNENLENVIARCKLHGWIDLRNQQLTDQDMHIVAELAISEKQCKVLDLGCNGITSKELSKITERVSTSKSIRRLYLGNNRVADDGVCILAPVVTNSSLYVLGLSNNIITDQGVCYLAEMLKRNKALTVLGLENNQIGNQGVEMLAAVLKNENSSLQHLLLAENTKITDSSVESLVNMLRSNKALNRLDLRNCSLSKTAKTTLRNMATSARDIQV